MIRGSSAVTSTVLRCSFTCAPTRIQRVVPPEVHAIRVYIAIIRGETRAILRVTARSRNRNLLLSLIHDLSRI